MRRRALYLLIALLVLGPKAKANGNGTQPPVLPVLRVTMQGTFTADMEYVNGQMQLTDAEGRVVTLPAKLKSATILPAR